MAGATAIHPLSLNPRLDATNFLMQHLMHVAHAPTVLWGVALFYFPALVHGPVRENNSGTFFFLLFCCCVVALRSEFAPYTQKNTIVDGEIATWSRLIDKNIDAHVFEW